MENQQNATDSRKAALSPKQTLALPYVAAAASLSAGASTMPRPHRDLCVNPKLVRGEPVGP